MIESMGAVHQIHMSDAELARDVAAVLEKVRQGNEIVVEQNHKPVAVIRAAAGSGGRGGRRISEVIAALEASGANAVIDDEFAGDVEAGIEAHRQPWKPQSWD